MLRIISLTIKTKIKNNVIAVIIFGIYKNKKKTFNKFCIRNCLNFLLHFDARIYYISQETNNCEIIVTYRYIEHLMRLSIEVLSAYRNYRDSSRQKTYRLYIN